ncbi:hypothetical protein IE53DRAFT_411323 [Violaceomyces palustris]|uniref:Uncharacterized protein n=1 Tax=Violaceomyces palustris TaxID=1673888 RepID=A0ACD0NVH5_9BASI|nr:hypothetical protein IE53DRAFT_411323 [Violaceomyces palustris]
MVRVPKPSRDDPDPSTKLPKTIKPLLSHLSTSLERLDQESKLIQRLWYKGRSQFRSAVWWRSFDGVRRSTKKLSASPQTTTDDPRDLDLPIPSLGHLALSSARKSYSSLWVEIGGGGDKSIGTSFHASKSSQPRKQQKESKGIAEPTSSSSSSSRTVFVFSPPTKSLERCDEERRATALNECLANFRSTLNLLSELHRSLIGLRARCRYAWYILSCHLRTPPAPTFAPQAVALLGVCSNLDQICSDLLYGRRDSNGGPSSSLSREGTHGGGDRETEGPPGSGLDRLYSVLYLTMSEFEVREEGDSQGEAASVDFDGDEARTRSLPLGDGGEGKMDPQDGRERKGKGKRKASPEGMGSGDGLESRKRKRLDTSDGDERKKGEEEEEKEEKREGAKTQGQPLRTSAVKP